ncbi:SMC-Scp complex subunit ScpB [Alicyclobacillus tolerans]
MKQQQLQKLKMEVKMLINLISAIEAILFVAGTDGLSTEEIADILQIPQQEVIASCRQLQLKLQQPESGIQLIESANTWQLATKPEHALYLRRMADTPIATSLSSAALETLAVIAYQQPITRSRIEKIRGVSSERAIQTLLHRLLIREVGREEGPGRPFLYGTTDHFLKTFAISSLEELPELPITDRDETTLLFERESHVPQE